MDPPNYAEGQFEQLRLNLAQAMGLTEQEAVAQLTTLWRQRNPPVQQNGPPAAPPQPPNNPPGPAAPLLIWRSLQKERKSTSRIPDPSDHALQRLRNYEYVELWYFTPKGCEAAASHAVTLEADTFTITKADSNLILLPFHTSAVPKGHIIQDQHLSFSEMLIARNNLIPHMAKCHWPPQLVQKFMDFFINLETHPIRSQPQGEQAILTYQDEAHRDWYRDLAASKASGKGKVT
ncbi:hypothetical protein AGABI2DRAFT_122550 [Agaricus bisporus var. bisporus H97]|uniref:hypothetical protein n=1 Tax=Agaricus bisporus var. bisporus (strain H97 / ATCC MYA-4626 / FGSC 10389) TaxID=936046 RepID=UPI00029F5924|nr:hypothetical protein AGABI2DRAFT_122550 [Agaricus bisporus var. bisporus H97]EKV42978.1 hypothetical protein AGABI2DRAFT_122550 [Agaricus bisporus var. bisporus H97]